MTPERVKWIREAMNQCFSNPHVQIMSDQQVISLFGVPDRTEMESGRKAFIYQIRDGQYGSGRLLRREK